MGYFNRSIHFFCILQLYNNGNWMGIIQQISYMFWSFGLIFILCNFGQKLTNQFDELNDALYMCDWYSFPLENQRMLPTILIATQQSVALKGFGNILCSRETSKSVSVFNLKIYFNEILLWIILIF